MGLPESERIVRILVHPKDGERRLRVRPRQALERQRRPRPLQDDRRREELVARPQGREPLDGLRLGDDGPEGPRGPLRRPLGLPPEGLDLPLRRRRPERPERERPLPDGRRREELDARSTAAANKGLPPAPWGRVEVAVRPLRPEGRLRPRRVDSDSALYRSADGGATWEARDKSQGMVWRPFYFARLIVDPKNPDKRLQAGPRPDRQRGRRAELRVQRRRAPTATGTTSGSTRTTRSTWSAGDDGGFWISCDGGNRWWKTGNLPVSQFYHVSVDAKDPYQVYGGLQDNSSWVGDSRLPAAASRTRAGRTSTAATASGWSSTRPTRTSSTPSRRGATSARVDRRTHASRDIQPKAGYKEKLRFNWNTPIAASPTRRQADLHRRAVPLPVARQRATPGSGSRPT